MLLGRLAHEPDQAACRAPIHRSVRVGKAPPHQGSLIKQPRPPTQPKVAEVQPLLVGRPGLAQQKVLRLHVTVDVPGVTRRWVTAGDAVDWEEQGYLALGVAGARATRPQDWLQLTAEEASLKSRLAKVACRANGRFAPAAPWWAHIHVYVCV
jgi:hypothetical protein